MAKKTTTKKPAAKKPAAKKPAAKKTVKKTTVKKPAVKKAALKKATAKKPAAVKTAAKKPKKAAVKAAKKSTVKKITRPKKPAARKAAAKKTTAKKPAAKKPAAKKTTAVKKPAVKKPAAEKATVKKPAAKKTTAKTIKTTWISSEKYRESVNYKLPAKIENKTGINLTNEDLAMLYLQDSKHENLLELCKKVLEQKNTKNSPDWLERQSNSCCYLGLWKDAIEVNKKRTSLFPKEMSAWNTLAVVYAILGDFKSAAGKLKEAEGKINWDIPFEKPDFNKKPLLKEEFYAFSKEDDPASFAEMFWPRKAMVVLYPRILEKAPESALGWYTLAKFYGDNMHYYDDAAKAIEKAVAIKPDWKPALAYKEQMLSFVAKTKAEDN